MDQTGPGVWRSDGTEAGTSPLRDRDGNVVRSPRTFAVAGGRLFIATDAPGVPLWQSDGTPQGTFRLRQLTPGTENASDELGVAGGRVFFRAYDPATGYELWAVDPE